MLNKDDYDKIVFSLKIYFFLFNLLKKGEENNLLGIICVNFN